MRRTLRSLFSSLGPAENAVQEWKENQGIPFTSRALIRIAKLTRWKASIENNFSGGYAAVYKKPCA